jgi:hypothetical protein
MEPENPEDQAERLALAVAQGYSLRQAARTADLPPTTARRWASEPSFKARVNVLRSECLSQTVGKLYRLATKAASTLGDLLDERNQPDLRLKAARAILQDLLAVRQHAELDDRLVSVEVMLAAESKRVP